MYLTVEISKKRDVYYSLEADSNVNLLLIQYEFSQFDQTYVVLQAHSTGSYVFFLIKKIFAYLANFAGSVCTRILLQNKSDRGYVFFFPW